MWWGGHTHAMGISIKCPMRFQRRPMEYFTVAREWTLDGHTNARFSHRALWSFNSRLHINCLKCKRISMSICLDNHHHHYRRRCALRPSRIVFGAAHTHGTRQIYRLISMYQSVTCLMPDVTPKYIQQRPWPCTSKWRCLCISFPGSIRWLYY